MKIHKLSVEDALKSLHSSVDGLTNVESARRLKEFGQNCIELERKKPVLLIFAKQFTHFFAIILWVAAGLAFWAEFKDPGQGMATLGFAILGVIFVNGSFSYWQEYRSEKAIEALRQLLPKQVQVMREKRILLVAVNELVPGDIMLVQEGDSVSADCRIIEAFGLRVNTATITGESVPKSRDATPSCLEDLLHSHNTLLAGTSVVSGEGKALVFATGSHTEFGKIAHLTQSTQDTVYPLQDELRFLSRLIAFIALALGLIFFWIGKALGIPLWQDLIFAIGIIVANVPEGLLPTVTLSLAMASQRMAKKNALIRHLPAVETLGSATVICTDKTGTLTENRMSIKEVYLGAKTYPIDEIDKIPAIAEQFQPFFEVALHCQNLRELTQNNIIGDPMEIALRQLAMGVLGHESVAPRVDEVPFDTERKMISTLHKTLNGLTLYTKGALETLLPCCQFILTKSGQQLLSASEKDSILQKQNEMAGQGLRLLGFAYRQVPEKYTKDHLEEALVFLGLAGFQDPPRKEVPEAIQKCHDAGIKVIMVTGDHPVTAEAIAKQIGLVRLGQPKVITGEQLAVMSKIQLGLCLDAEEIVFARVTASQKMAIVEALKAKEHVVAVTGDGVNDAPALKAADIGIAMGIAGTDVAKAAADIVLLDDNFASIVSAIEEGRAVFSNIRKFLTYILTHNIPELVPYLAFSLFRIPLPLTVIQILSIDLGTDTLPALALGTESPEPDVMQRKPRLRHERLINNTLLARAYLFLGPIEAIASMSAFFLVLHLGGWRFGQVLSSDNILYKQATTATLSAIIVMQVFNIFLCRSEQESIFLKKLPVNKYIFYGIVFEIGLILAIDYLPIGHFVFGTAPIPWAVWVFILPFACGMLLLDEIRKWLLNAHRSHS